MKGQIVDILGIVGHTVSVAATQLCVARSSLRQNVKNDYVSVTIKLYLYKQILGWIHSSGHSLPIANYEFEINSKSPLVCILMINKNFLLMYLSCHTYAI